MNKIKIGYKTYDIVYDDEYLDEKELAGEIDTRIDRMIKRGGMTDEEISRRFKADELDFIGMEENADLCANTGEYSTEDIAKIIAGVFDVE